MDKIEVYLKRNIAAFPPSSDALTPIAADEEQFFLSAGTIESHRETETLPVGGGRYGIRGHGRSLKVVICNFQLSDRFLLIDLYAPQNRMRIYRRCGFSTKKYRNRKILRHE
jgi:hypothetical protein